MGRVKIEIKKIENATNRQVTYSKRRNGLLKKAFELSVLCDIDIVVLMYSPSGKLTTHCRPETSVEDVLQRFVDTPAQERTKRRDENLQLLEKIVRKLNAEKEGGGHLLRAGWSPAEQSDVAAKQRQIEYLKSCIQHSPSLEDLVRARIEQSASIAELEQLERSMENGLLQVQNQRHIVQGMESLRIRQHFNQHFQQHVQQPAPQNPGERHPMSFAGPSNSAETPLPQFCFAGPSNSGGTPLPQFCFAGPSNSAETPLPQFLPVPMLMDMQHPMQLWQPQSSEILQAQAKGKGRLNEEPFADIGQASGAPAMDNPDLQNLHPMQHSQGLPDLESHYQYLRRQFPRAQSSSIRQAQGKGKGQLEEERLADIGEVSGAPGDASSAAGSAESDFGLSTIPYTFPDRKRRFR